MNKNVIRHGDMILFKISAERAEKMVQRVTNELTVGLGEVSGHAHKIRPVGPKAEVLEFSENFENSGTQEFIERPSVIFQVKGGNAVISHEEHAPVILEPGLYERIIQVNFDPFADELRRVRD